METEAILARWSVVVVKGNTSVFMIALLVLCGGAHAPNEVGD